MSNFWNSTGHDIIYIACIADSHCDSLFKIAGAMLSYPRVYLWVIIFNEDCFLPFI